MATWYSYVCHIVINHVTVVLGTSKMEVSVNPLAVPKGQKLLCEICQQPARLQCAMCKATYYWWVM